MKKNTKVIIGIFILIFLMVLIWRIILLISKSSENSSWGGSQRAVAVQVEPITLETIKDIQEFTGTIYPEYQYIVSSKVNGRLLKLKEDIGDYVELNDTIAVIDDAEYQQVLQEAQANLAIAQANLTEASSQFNLAKIELERVKSINEKGFGSEADLQNAQAEYIKAQSQVDLAQAQIKQKKAALATAEIQLSYTILKASKPGYIGERFADEGGLLTANAPIVSVVGINEVIVRSQLIEKIYGKIKIGQRAMIYSDAIPNRSFPGKVTRIAPVLDEKTRTAQMEIAVQNPEQLLKPGMFCRITIVLEEKNNAQIVPSKAIVKMNGDTGIYIADMEASIAKYIPVTIGITDEKRTEILEPKIEGMVITIGQYLLRDGSSIIIPNADTEN